MNSSEEKLKLMAEVKNNIIEYLQGELTNITNALAIYDNAANSPIQEQDPEIRKMRETEAIKLRDRQYELNRHISVIKLMIP